MTSKPVQVSNLIRVATYLPCVAFCLWQFYGSGDSATHSLLLGLPVALAMSVVYVGCMRLITPVAVPILRRIEDPQTRMLTAFVPALAVWLPVICVPSLVIGLLKSLIAVCISAMVAGLIGLGLAYLIARSARRARIRRCQN